MNTESDELPLILNQMWHGIFVFLETGISKMYTRNCHQLKIISNLVIYITSHLRNDEHQGVYMRLYFGNTDFSYPQETRDECGGGGGGGCGL